MGNVAQELDPPIPEEEIARETAELEKERAEEKEPKAEVKAEETPPEKEPEAKAEEKKEKKHKYTDEEGNPLVRLDALHESRQQSKQLKMELARSHADYQQRMALLDQRLQMLYQAQNPPPDPATDPVGAQAYELAQVKRTQEELLRRTQWEEAQRAQAAQTEGLVSWARAESQQFASENPDFADAYQTVVNKRIAELKALGLDGPALQNTLVQDELWVFQHAAQSGRNPAEVIYSMAKAIGYTGKAAPKAAVDPAQKIEAMQKGLAASKTLEGGVPSGKPTAEQIANMSEDDFAELMKKYGSLERALA